MEGPGEYQDAWRGLSIHVPAGWRLRRSGMGLVLCDGAGRCAVVLQPRPGVASLEGLEGAVLAWLRRCDPSAELYVEPEGAGQGCVCAALLRPAPGDEARARFFLQVYGGCGYVSGYLAPAATCEADGHVALETLCSLRPIPAVERYLWREPLEGASSALVPRGWRVEGRVSRENPLGMPAAGLQAWADEWTGVMVGAEARLYLEPGLLGGLLGGLVGGFVGQAGFVGAAEYAEVHLLPALRAEAPDARIERVTERSDLIPLMVAREAASSGLRVEDALEAGPSVADVVFSFCDEGRGLRQLTRVMTMRMPPSMGRGLPLWVANVPYSCRAPADRFEGWEPVLEGIAASFRVSPEWRQKEQARMMRQFGRVLPGTGEPPDAALLLEKAERLVCRVRPLGIHERPFAVDLGRDPDRGEEGLLWPPAVVDGARWRGLEPPEL